jgi:hypothetical protein
VLAATFAEKHAKFKILLAACQTAQGSLSKPKETCVAV